ncbi:uncharacterized protein PSANT_04417 [Moesziomyces antarcticus]|nr:uncharacterized protein PSANT_04417 [Moesziomyces antarcticus]
MRSPPGADYGAVVRRLTQLCQQVDALVAPVPVPASLQPQTDGRSPSPTPSTVANSTVTIPRLVLVGGQSTGKTSLVECLAGVSLPRSQGTCTRGPLDVTITSSDAGTKWSATVHILLPASHQDHTQVQFGDVIQHPDHVADRLRRATLAVRDLASLPVPSSSPHGLSPVIIGNKYDLLSEDELDEAEDSDALPTFFPKGARLSLSVRAPDAEPLRFTDLPGLISEGHAKDVTAIRNMVFRDISDENTIIVLTASFAMDIAHQNAFSLVKTADAQGDRTIGVLTMPDRMPSGAERQWSKVINESLSGHRNGKHYLKHGWHVVRCPAQHESRDDVGGLENTFFKDKDRASPWYKTVAMLDSDHGFIEECCGLQTLYLRLSRLLLNAIKATLPSIISRLQSAAAQHKAAYDAIAATNPTTSYQSLVLGKFLDTDVDLYGSRVRSFDVIIELIDAINGLNEQLRILSSEIAKHLVPYLRLHLMALAPKYVPLTATEAAEAAVLRSYEPRPWSFEAILGHDVGPSYWLGAADNDFGDDDKGQFRIRSPSTEPTAEPGTSSRQLVRRSKLKKKRETLDDITNALASNPHINHMAAPITHLTNTHTLLQARFRSVVQEHHRRCKDRLGELVHRAIGTKFQTKYPHLCEDVVKIASGYVQSRLDSEMQGLADRVKAHALIGQGSAGINMGEDMVSKYKQWVDEEMQAYLLIRTSLVARQRAAEGIHKDFVSNATKVVTSAIRCGMVPADTTGKPEARATPEMADDALDPASPPATPKKERKPKGTAAAAASDNGAGGSIPMLPQLLLVHRLMIGSEEEGMLRLMAELRADFNFFALEVTKECIRIPTTIMETLHSTLRSEALAVIRANRSEEELYQRYFYEADRPRRERNEYTSALGQRVEGLNAAVAELQALQVELDGPMSTSPWPAPGPSRESTHTHRKNRTKMLELEAFANERSPSPTPTPTPTPERLPQASLGIKMTPTKRSRADASGSEQRRKPSSSGRMPSSSGRTAGRDSDADASPTPEGWTDIISLPSSSDVED